jgi:hypothetical protein
MFSRLREHVGTAGLVVAIVALIAALGGGAYAATGGSGGSKATASAKGKPGPRGKTGPAGPAGPAGSAGPKGDTGSPGANGAPGSPGANGKSVVTATETPGVHCAEGGTSVEVEGAPASKKYVCNGEEGEPGEPGPTCLNGKCELPVGATETGIWGFTAINVAEAYENISFPLRVPGESEFHYVTGGESGTAPAIAEGCAGTFEQPKAVPKGGKPTLCMYEGTTLTNASVPHAVAGGDITSGVTLDFPLVAPPSEAYGNGTWAVAR